LSFLMTWTGVNGNRIDNNGLYALATPTAEFNRVKNIYDFYPKPSFTDVHRRSDLFIEDGSYVRLRNVRLDYKLPLSAGKFVKSANIYVSGQNLLTFTKYSGFDPEVNSYSGNDLRQGVDLGAYPAAKSYTMGLSVSF
jgi:TonB-dependent starch-binding outer membrane protein SusC